MFENLFDKLLLETSKPKVHALEELIESMRVRDEAGKHHKASVDELAWYLEANPDKAEFFLIYLVDFVSHYKTVDVYTHAGLLSGRGFWTLLTERIGERLIPGVGNKRQLSYILTSIFNDEEDVKWLGTITDEQWLRLFTVFASQECLGTEDLDALRQIQRDILHAIKLVSYEISGLSLNEEVIKAYPEIMELDSSFIAQNQEILAYVKDFEAYLAQSKEEDHPGPLEAPVEDHILVMLEQCTMLIKETHKNTYATGVSISLTNILARLEQKVERLEQLIFLLHPSTEKKSEAFGELIYSITRGHRESSRIRPLVRSNTELVSLRITESATKIGETYVARDLASQWRMFLVSAGAGVLIGIMATIKILLGKLVLAPVGKAILNSFNYGFGFVLIYVCHFKIATKQPAMTASALASSIEHSKRHKKAELTELSELIVDILRTQIAAIAGNVALAMPVAFLVCYAWESYLQATLLSQDKAKYLLQGIDPFGSPSLIYAALTGVFLFLSGIISGYYDNLAVYRNLGRRVSRQSLMLGAFGKFRARRIGNYIEKNFGSITGNFWFGVMLGSTPTIGYILGLPLDIRHIAFSSANFVQGIFWLDEQIELSYALYLFAGVLLIGVVNLLVSFSLALMVALRARSIKFAQWKELMVLVASRILKNPLLLFLPFGKAKPAEGGASSH